MRTINKLLRFLVIAMSAAYLQVEISKTDLGRRFEYMALDLWFHLRGPVVSPGDVVIVGIDEESYKKLDASPFKLFPRALLAEFLERAAAFGVKGVALDLVPEWEGPDKEVDERLARALKLLPTAIGTSTLTRQETNVRGEVYEKYIEAKPNPLFANAAAAVGTIMLPIHFGQVRGFPLRNFPYVRPEAPLAEETAKLFAPVVEGPSPKDFINFYGPSGSMPYLSIYKFFNPAEEETLQALAGRVLLVGPTLSLGASGAAKDTAYTPYNEAETFGVEIEAAAAQNLISRNWIKTLPAVQDVRGQYLLVFLSSFLLMVLRPVPGGVMLFSIIGLWAFGVYHSFLNNLHISGAVAIVVALPLVYLCATFYYYFVTQRSRKEIRKAFKHYVPGELVDQIAEQPELLKQGGKLVEIATFFTDLAGFSGLSEKLPPEKVAGFLNRYFTETGGLVLKEGGTLIKFIGDGIFAVWGAPLPVKDGADAARRAAVAMQKCVTDLGHEFSFPMLATRIGIHYGSALVGNLGTDKRFDYTAIGDNVNIASRLESLNKEFGTSILFSDEVYSRLTAHEECLALGLVRLPGRVEPLSVFTCFENLAADVRFKWYRAWAQYKRRRWDKAEKLFGAVVNKEQRLHKVASIYLAEVASYRKNLPKDGWQGELAFVKDSGFCRVSTGQGE